MVRRWVPLVVLVACAGCSDEDGSAAGSFIALQSNFADFRSWKRTFVGDQPIEGHPPGPRYGYQSELPGPTEYAVGAIVVKTVERTEDPLTWDIFAMSKRGGNFNATGAKNWEFLTLRIGTDGTPVIASRGNNPVDADSDGGADSYGQSTTGVTCNRCHGIPGTEQTDHILSPLLAPGSQ